MTERARRSATGFVALGVVATLVAATPALASGRQGLQRSPSPGQDRHLLGVSAVSASDAWAVGDSGHKTLIEHWDGTDWATVPSPDPGKHASLAGVSAVSASDAWAVGRHDGVSGGAFKTLIEHWDGTTWATLPSPDPGRYSALYSVSAMSASDAWAVGTRESGGAPKTLIEHWDGTTWTAMPSPGPGANGSALYGVSAVSASDAWAVGQYTTAAANKTLIEHWDGTIWNKVASPNPGRSPYLQGVGVVSASDAWAIGHYFSGSKTKTLIEHWDGTSWTQTTSPNPGRSISVLRGVSVVSESDAWAVGEYQADPLGASRTLIEHWDGTSWTRVPSPSPGGTNPSNLNGVSAVSPSDAWAVGSYLGKTDTAYKGLLEHWDGTNWTKAPPRN